MASILDTSQAASTWELPKEKVEGSSARGGYWALVVVIALVTIGLLYGSYFFFIS
ncbi:MAG: hypothetical protein HY672_04235 [Chloroflexi bacterium]|nr:hypothetical protein [Chloroflexota bacterium]